MEQQGTNFGSFFKGLLIGSLIFGMVALFTAPHSGVETRQIIREKGDELRDKTVETIDIVRDQMGSAISDVRQRADDAVERIGTL
jgi:gas vesicle protein